MLKVVAGTLRGRTLRAPRGLVTRPTAARVREAIFDVLAHNPAYTVRFEDARALDLFAGSGAMGIEALSRGARRAVFVERSRGVAETLRRNLADLAIEPRASVLTTDVRQALPQLALAGERFDVVFLDPPYAHTRTAEDALMAQVGSAGILAEDAVVVLERSPDCALPAVTGLAEPATRRWGDTEVLFYRHA